MTDTRSAFERHFQLSQRQAKKDNAGEYIDEKVRDKWEGWQAAKAPNDGITLERAFKAAHAANHQFGQWMPEAWLRLFVVAYNEARK